MEWVLRHMEDPGFNNPLEPPAAALQRPSLNALPGLPPAVEQPLTQSVCCRTLGRRPAWSGC